MKKTIVISFVCIFAIVIAQAQTPNYSKDLDYIAQKLPSKHANFTQFINKEAFAKKVAQLKARLPQLNPTEFRVELMRLLASLNDMTTMLPLSSKFHAFPLRLHWFTDGLFVADASPKYAQFKGAQVIKINRHTANEVFTKVKPFISAENDYLKRTRFFATRGMAAEVLKQAGVIEDVNQATFTLKLSNGKTEQVKVKTILMSDFLSTFYYKEVDPVTHPATSQRQNTRYWMKYMPVGKILYVQFNQLRDNKAGESLSGFTKRIVATADKTDFDRFVVDLRHGGGGSGHRARKVLNALRKHPKINQQSVLFVLIGGKTIGTCAEFATMLELRTKAILVGSESGQSPNWVGDISVLTLPESKLKLYYSNTFWPISIPQDARKYLTPQVKVNYTYAQFANQTDPALEAVKNYPMSSPPFNPPSPTLKKQLVGKYKIAKGRTLVIYDKDGHLFAKMRAGSPRSLFGVDTELHLRNGNQFATDIANVSLKLEMANDKVKALVWDWKGTKVRLKR